VPDLFVLVDGPGYTPLPYGLLSVAPPITEPDAHWVQGVQWQPEVCRDALSLTALCVTGVGPSGTPVSGMPIVAAQSFRVYSLIECAPVGQGNDAGRLRARADAALTNGEARAVEHVFWTGNAANGTVLPHLAEDTAVFGNSQGAATVQLQSAATVLGGGTALDVVEAFGSIEGALAACYGGVGVLHVPRAAVPHLANKNLCYIQGGQLRTYNGNLVAAYSPGDRAGPTGADPAAGQAWMYATGQVVLRRGQIVHVGETVPDFLDRTDNTLSYMAYRYYSVGWECCHYAVNVSLGGDITGTQGAAT